MCEWPRLVASHRGCAGCIQQKEWVDLLAIDVAERSGVDVVGRKDNELLCWEFNMITCHWSFNGLGEFLIADQHVLVLSSHIVQRSMSTSMTITQMC